MASFGTFLEVCQACHHQQEPAKLQDLRQNMKGYAFKHQNGSLGVKKQSGTAVLVLRQVQTHPVGPWPDPKGSQHIKIASQQTSLLARQAPFSKQPSILYVHMLHIGCIHRLQAG